MLLLHPQWHVCGKLRNVLPPADNQLQASLLICLSGFYGIYTGDEFNDVSNDHISCIFSAKQSKHVDNYSAFVCDSSVRGSNVAVSSSLSEGGATLNTPLPRDYDLQITTQNTGLCNLF
jgi:hypothetical protein